MAFATVGLAAAPAVAGGGKAAGGAALSAGTLLKTASAVGGLVSAASSFAGGSAAAQSSNLQAEFLRRQAERERQIGELNARRERERNRALQATQRALLAGQGRDISGGSALLVQEDLAEEGEFNAQIIENNSEATVNSLQTQRTLELMKGKSAQQTSFFRTGSALLKGASAFA